MKKEKLLFLLIPTVQVLASVRYFKSYKQVVSSIIFVLSGFLFSLLLYKLLCIVFSKFKLSNKHIIGLLVLLSFLDQVHKSLLEVTGFNSNIIGEYFQIKQTHNINQMAILNHFNIELNIIAVVAFKIILFMIFAFCLFKVKNSDYKIGLVLLVSAQLSSTLDSLIRGFVLDSFYYYKLVCYDLKDYYVDAGLAIILIAYISEQTSKRKIQ